MTVLRLERPGDEDGLPVIIEVCEEDGAWTPGPFCNVSCGNEIELDLDRLAWLVEDAGPAALAKLRALAGA